MSQHFTLPATGYVRLPTVLHHIPVGKSTWWDGIQTGRFPKPIKLSERCTAWRAEDIHELIRALGLSLKQDGDSPPSASAR
jgi:prophage regulatory protein